MGGVTNLEGFDHVIVCTLVGGGKLGGAVLWGVCCMRGECGFEIECGCGVCDQREYRGLDQRSVCVIAGSRSVYYLTIIFSRTFSFQIFNAGIIFSAFLFHIFKDILQVHLRQYATKLKKTGTKLPHVELAEMGPHMDLTIRRTKVKLLPSFFNKHYLFWSLFHERSSFYVVVCSQSKIVILHLH